MTADEPVRTLGAPPSDVGDDESLHRSHVGHERHAGIEQPSGRVGDRAHGQRDERDVGAGGRLLEIHRDRSDRAQLSRPGEPIGIAVEADDVVSELDEREPDRATDQARADDRGAHDYSGRSSRRDRAPSRYT